MHSAFAKTNYSPLFQVDTGEVNKFCLLSFGKNRSTEVYCRHKLAPGKKRKTVLMNNSTAFQVGQIVGVIIAVLMMISFLGFFVFALVKAFTTRRKGWIIAASVASLPFLLFLGLFLMAMVMGFTKGMNRSNEMAAARHGDPSELLAAAMTPVSGNALPYEISLPVLSAWAKNDSRPPFDYLFSYRDAYVAIIPEGIGLGTPEKICAISRKNLESKASRLQTTTPVSIEIDSHSWLTYDATATVEGVDIIYRFYVYADSNYTFQIVTWTGTPLFKRYAPVFDRIAKTFKMPR